MATYQTCHANLTTFVNSLPKTNVKFLFYLAKDLGSPKMRTCLSYWDIDKKPFYLTFGQDNNFVYVYKESSIKLLVQIINKPAPAPSNVSSFTSKPSHINNIVNVKIVDSSSGDVTLGNHVDFNITAQRNGDVLIKSHATLYRDIDLATATRIEDQCNFILRNQDFDDLTRFGNIACESRYSEPTGATIQTIYTDPDDKNIMFRLCRIIKGIVSYGGSFSKKYTKYNGKRYLQRLGKKGGIYIEPTNTRRVYIKKQKTMRGGAVIDYRGVTFFSDTFITFLSTRILIPVGELRQDLLSVQVLYDEYNELDENGNVHIIVIYDFEADKRNLFYINAITLLTACYADDVLKTLPVSTLLPNEIECYNNIIPIQNRTLELIR